MLEAVEACRKTSPPIVKGTALAIACPSTRAGATSHNAIAAKLNERNVNTARGGRWTHVQVGAILHPFEESAAVA